MKLLFRWLISALAIAVTVYLLPGVHTTGIVPILVLAIVLGIINMILRPVLIILTLPLTIFSLGLFVLVINALLVMLAAAIVPGVMVDGFWWALAFGVVLALVHAALHKMEK